MQRKIKQSTANNHANTNTKSTKHMTARQSNSRLKIASMPHTDHPLHPHQPTLTLVPPSPALFSTLPMQSSSCGSDSLSTRQTEVQTRDSRRKQVE